MIVHPPLFPDEFEKKDFVIHLTQKEPFWWNTAGPYYREDADGIVTAIPGFPNLKGFMFVWAIDNDKDRSEIDWDYLKGDCIIYGGGAAFQYNAIPHQCLAEDGDRVLNLDGVEYTMATSQVMVAGMAGNYIPGLCAGLSIAIEHLGNPISADTYPILTTLYRQGVRGLVNMAADICGYLPQKDFYINKCDLCTEVRTALVRNDYQGSKELMPAEFYFTNAYIIK